MINYSFIIPHHNTPDLLQRLVDSIPQRDDIEIIVVDDNSDYDKKANISRSDVRTIYIDKVQTKGAGRARNVGMDAATGRWLLFADSDDFYNPGFIDVLDEYKDDDIDILFFNIDSVDTLTLEPDNFNRAGYQQMCVEKYDGSKDSINRMLYFRYAPWCKMLNHDFVNYFGFRFEEISIFNDSFFALQTSHFARKWKVDKRKLYTVTFRVGSITFSRVSNQKIADSMVTYRRRAKLYEYIGHPEWNVRCYKGKYYQSCWKYIYKLAVSRHLPMSAIRAFFYYIMHWHEIEKKSYFYVDVFKTLQLKDVK